MKNMLRSALIVITLLCLVSCGVPGDTRPSGQNTWSDKGRVASPDVTAPDLADLVSGNSDFAFDLYHVLREEGENHNLFYSPYSISLALAMTYAGGRGETEQQTADTLPFTLPQDRLHPAFNGLDLELASRGEGAEGRVERAFGSTSSTPSGAKRAASSSVLNHAQEPSPTSPLATAPVTAAEGE